jgi:UDP-N-acetylmuramate dehydrogenase
VTPPIREEEPLARHTSLKVGGPADYFAEARSTEDMAALLRWASNHGQPVHTIGGGSNLLVAETGVAGLVVKILATSTRVEDQPDGPVLVAAAGATFANVARRLAKQGFGDLEWAANVPGTVGGAVVNNAGAFGGETARSLVAATIVNGNGEQRRLLPEDLGYSYRTSVLKRRELGPVMVTHVELRVKHTEPEAAQAIVAEFQAQRTHSQPRQLSAGSVFANPPGTYSGKLIEEAGLKGHRLGGAEISRQHANFIVNSGGATADDVYGLMRHAQDVVFQRTGIWLRTEIELFGRWSETERRELQGSAPAEHAA